jgi:hypothetical protein
LTTIPNGAASLGSGVGDEDSSVRSPPSRVKPPTARAPVSYREMLLLAVFTVNRWRPS